MVLIIRIENLRDIFSFFSFVVSLCVVAVVESEEVKYIERFSLPQTESIDIIRAVADDSHVIRNSLYSLVCKLYYNGIFFSPYAPRVTETLPVVSYFKLCTISELLLEQAVLIAYAIAVKRYIMGCSGIEETSCQSAKTTVAECSVIYFFKDIDVNTLVCKEFLCLFQYTE